MKKIIIFLVIAILVITGCAEQKEAEKPQINIVEEPAEIEEQPAVEKQEENITEEQQPESSIKEIEITATETRFIPAEIRLAYNETVKLAIISNYSHNFYAPGLQINKAINKGKTEIYVPTYRKGSYNFWCNIPHYGTEHIQMKGKIYIE